MKIIRYLREILLAFIVMFTFMTCMLYAADIGVTRVENSRANP